MSEEAEADEIGEVIFLTVDQVIDLHEEGIASFSPGESLFVRDRGLLESAVMTPQQTFGGDFLYHSISEMAAAYLIGLSLNHPFENGNKRAAFIACSVFLRINGFLLTMSQDEAEMLTFGVSKHELSREDVVKALDGAIDIIQ